jgi:hypothetical protein
VVVVIVAASPEADVVPAQLAAHVGVRPVRERAELVAGEHRVHLHAGVLEGRGEADALGDQVHVHHAPRVAAGLRLRARRLDPEDEHGARETFAGDDDLARRRERRRGRGRGGPGATAGSG